MKALLAKFEGCNGTFVFTMDIDGPLEEALAKSTGSSNAWDKFVSHLYAEANHILSGMTILVVVDRQPVIEKVGEGNFKNEYKIAVPYEGTTVRYTVAIDVSLPLYKETVDDVMASLLEDIRTHTSVRLKHPTDAAAARAEEVRNLMTTAAISMFTVDMPWLRGAPFLF